MENYSKPISEMNISDFLEEEIVPSKNQYRGNNDKTKKYRKQVEHGANSYKRKSQTLINIYFL